MKHAQKIFNSICLLVIFALFGCGSGSEQTTVEPPVGQQTFQEYITSQNFSGSVLIIQDGNTLLNQGFGFSDRSNAVNNSPDTIFRLASVTKQFTAMAIMILQERGLLSIDDMVSTHIVDYPNGEQITLKHLLTHTSGTPNFTALPEYNAARFQYHTPTELVAIFKDLPLDFTPGSRYSYSNSGYILLGLIIEQVSGQFYADFIKQEIFAVLGMDNSEYGSNNLGINNTAKGYKQDGRESDAIDMSVPYSAGALSSTLNDLYKWDQSFYQDALVSAATKAMIYTSSLNNYGLGWVINTNNYYHNGGIDGFSTYIGRDPSQNRLIVVLSNVERFPSTDLANHLATMIP